MSSNSLVLVAGTNFAAKIFFEYGLIPPELGGAPDIVITAHGTNDLHIFRGAHRKRLETYEKFLTSVFGKPQGGQQQRTVPMIINVEDYVGNQPMEVSMPMESARMINVLADYYGFASLSYPSMIRHLIYGDTREEWFSPVEWYHGNDGGGGADSPAIPKQNHPGMGMHIATSWMLAYYMVHVTATYCSLETTWNVQDAYAYEATYEGSKIAERIPLRSKRGVKSVPDRRPREPPRGPPPMLTDELGMDQITQAWRENERKYAAATAVSDNKDSERTRCIFSWVSGLQTDPSWVEGQFRERIVNSRGWKLDNDHHKLGYVPTIPGDFMTLEFRNVTQPIREVLVFYMKSYGDRWEGSKLVLETGGRAVVSPSKEAGTLARSGGEVGEWEPLTKQEMVGNHRSTTSTTEVEQIALPREIPVGGGLQLHYEFVGLNGTTFKMQGLAICS